jgi:hypothetical protein
MSCEKIYENKDYLISQYNKIHNLYQIACEEHIDYHKLSFYFKKWGIKLNIDDNGLPERKYKINDNFLDDMKELQYWFVGLIASDGSRGKHNQITLSQSSNNGLKLIQYINELLCSSFPIKHNATNGEDAHSITFTSKNIVDKLENYNIIRNKTYSYTLPEIPDQYFTSFLAGYIEGDGCITISHNGLNCHYLCASFVGTKEFVEACQKRIPIESNKIRKCHNSSVYEIRWNGEKAIEFCDWLYSYDNLYHSYKYDNYIKAKENFKNTRKERYKIIKDQVLNDFKNGRVGLIMEYAKKINIPFQTIYTWKKKWEGEGLI